MYYMKRDGVEAWIRFSATFLVFMIIGGLDRNFGIWYVEIYHNLEGSSSISAWVGGINTGIRLGMAPVVVIMCNKWSPQCIGIVGGIIYGMSIFISAFIENPTILLLTFGVVGGFGAAMAYFPPYVITSRYFDKNKNLALAILHLGFGTGAFLMSMILTYLFANFSYFEAVTFIAGIVLQLVPAGAMFVTLPPDNTELIAQFSGAGKSPIYDHEMRKFEEEKIPLLKKPTTERPIGSRKGFHIEFLINPSVIFMTLGACLCACAIYPYNLLVVDFAIDRGIPEERSALILTVNGIVELISRLFIGLIVQMRKMKPFLYQAWIASGIGIAIASVATTQCNELWEFILSASGNVFFYGASYTIGPIVASQYFTEEAFPDIISLNQSGCGIGTFIGSAISGSLKDLSSSYILSYFVMGVASLVSSSFFVLTYLFIIHLRRQRPWYLLK